VLSMDTLVATRVHPQFTVCEPRLLAAGTLQKVALTACLHMVVTLLPAMRKQRTAWQAQEVHNYKRDEAPLTTKTVALLVPRSGH